MSMQQLINDKPKNFPVLIICFVVSTIAIGSFCYFNLLSINKQWHTKGLNALQILEKKNNWLTITLDQMPNMDDMEKQIVQISECLSSKDNITKKDIDLIFSTRQKEYKEEAAEQAKKCEVLLATLSDSRHELSELSMKGSSILTSLHEFTNTTEIKELEEIHQEANKTYSNLNQLCGQQIILTQKFNNIMKECRRIITFVENKQSSGQDRGRIEKNKEEYDTWKQTVTMRLNHCNELERSLHKAFENLKAIPSTPKDIQEKDKTQINDELIVLNPAQDNDINNNGNSAKHQKEENEKLQLTAQKPSASNHELKEQHDDKAKLSNLKDIQVKDKTQINDELIVLNPAQDNDINSHENSAKHQKEEKEKLQLTALQTSASNQKLKEQHDDKVKLPNLKDIQEKAQKQINDELNVLNPLIDKATDLCDNSVKRLEEEIGKLQLTAQETFNSIHKLKEQHGDYVDTANVTTARHNLDSFIAFHQTMDKNIDKHCKTIRDNISTVKLVQGKVQDALVALKNFGNDIDNKSIEGKQEENLTHIRELQLSRSELENNLKSLANDLTQLKTDAKEFVNKNTVLLTKIQQSFPDWASEGRKITKDFNWFHQQADKIKNNVKTLEKDFIYYRDKGDQGKMALLRLMCRQIQDEISHIENMHNSEQSCSNGKELMELKTRFNNLKRHAENAEQKMKELVAEQDNALKTGTLQRIRYVPFSNSIMASQLQQKHMVLQRGDVILQHGNVVSHFDFSLDIPTGGYHKVEIRFRKEKQPLYKISLTKKYVVVIKYEISGKQRKSGSLRYSDMNNPPLDELPIVLEGNFTSGINDIDLDLSFKAEDTRGATLLGGRWQFQYEDKKFFESKSTVIDNFAMEILLDGNPADVLMREQDL